jgi:hypothetical protein
LLGLAAGSAAQADSFCSRWLMRARAAAVTYVREVKETRGLRLVIKNSPPGSWWKYRRPTIPAATVIAVLAMSVYHQTYDRALEDKIVFEIRRNADAYDHLIRSDFRFHSIAQRLARGEIDRDQARQMAFLTQLAYKNYYEYRSAHEQDGPAPKTYLGQTLFLHLQPVIDSRKLSDESIEHLVQINHDLFLRYAMIDGLVTGGLASLPDDPFTNRVLQMWGTGRVDKDRARYLLQQDAFWSARLSEYRTAGLVKYKLDQDGRETNQPLTLEDIRREALSEYD